MTFAADGKIPYQRWINEPAPVRPDRAYLDRQFTGIEGKLKEPSPYTVIEGGQTVNISPVTAAYLLGASGSADTRSDPAGWWNPAGYFIMPERGLYETFALVNWGAYGAGGNNHLFVQALSGTPAAANLGVGHYSINVVGDGMALYQKLQLNKGDLLYWLIYVTDFTVTFDLPITYQLGYWQIDKGPPQP